MSELITQKHSKLIGRKKKKDWLIDKSSSRVAGDSNHFRNATLKKGMLPENQRGRLSKNQKNVCD